MRETTLRFFLAVVLVAALSPADARSEPVAAKKATGAVQDKTHVSVFNNGNRPMLRYRYAEVSGKPYVDQIFSPAGVQVLRDSPFDHKHHHALMFAMAVDGVNFWEELNPKFGTQKQRSLKTINHTAPDGDWRAGLVEELDWMGPTSDKPLLVERREVVALEDHGPASPPLGATLVEWRCRLETPQGKDSAVLSGDHFYGLGVRFLQSMDGGRFLYAGDTPGEVVRGTERLTPVKWCAYVAKADGKPVTVAVFDYPENLRYPAKMFTMNKPPFPYLAATRNEWKKPITIQSGKPLNLRYGVAVWDGEADKATIEKLYQRWLQLSANIP
jgi:hypothetical protein